MPSSLSRADALAVRVRWGDVRVASHLVGPGHRQGFSVGPGADDVTARGGRVEVRWAADGPGLRFGPGVTGGVVGGPTLSEAVGAGRAREEGEAWWLPLPGDAPVSVRVGPLDVEVRPVRAPRRMPLAPMDWDFRFLNVLLCVGLLALLGLASVLLEPRAEDREDDALTSDAARWRRVLVEAPVRAPPVPTPRQARREERRTTPATTPTRGRPGPQAPRPPSRATPEAAQALRTLLQGGLAGSSVFSGGGLGNQLGLATAGLVAAGPGAGGGAALGLRGGGGGGELGGPVGIGVSVLGRPGPGDGDPGRGLGDLRRPTIEPPRVEVSNTGTCQSAGEGKGCLDKEALRRVIRAHLGQVRACYELALQRRPDLGGKVVVRFEVGASGNVTGAAVTADSSLRHDGLEACLTSRVRGWVFPASGGAYVVSYPFLFRTPGG